MGSNNANKWLSGWVKKRFPDSYRDLCTSFVDRGTQLASEDGYVALITSDTCMYISSFEKLRKRVIDETTIVSFIDTRGTNAHPDVFDANAGWILFNKPTSGFMGSYFKLSQPIADKEARYLEALADPDCGWFYRRESRSFNQIPNCSIAYWASSSLFKAFSNGDPLRTIGRTSKGLITGDNKQFLRLWWECGLSNTVFSGSSFEETLETSNRWFACTKGGPFRKWAGNTEWVVDWRGNGEEVRKAALENGHHCQDYANELKFAESVTWTDVSSSIASFRYARGFLSEHAGMCDFFDQDKLKYSLAFMNTSIAKEILALIAPTLHFNAGDIDSLPLLYDEAACETIETLVQKAIATSLYDWNTSETAWGYAHHPLV